MKKGLLSFVIIYLSLIGLQTHVFAQESTVSIDALYDAAPNAKKLSKSFEKNKVGLLDIYNYSRQNPEVLQNKLTMIIEAAYWNAENNDRKAAKDGLWADIRYYLTRFVEVITSLKEPQQKTFMDIGCGSGQKVYTALCLGFDKAYGLEYSPDFYGYATSYLQDLIDKQRVELTNGDALKIDESYYSKADFMYMYSPMKDDNDMALFFWRAMKNMKEGSTLVEVRMVYAPELKETSKYQIPEQENGFFALRKREGKYYYKSVDNPDWAELKPVE